MLPNGINTYAGIVVALAPTILGWFGLTPTPEFGDQFTENLAAVVTLLGGLYAVYGKLRHQIPGWFK